ncbi:hypothetical protein E3C22_19385 [Jiella endophytica]|uniref:Uncharacterized protein n=1 Tax=Jiella endophytica TaxID=2558362 RepID=A0A4Y8RDD6_9HYPH|nr:hypothetical protein [Jiella endophytica]TFF19837.1 hypothetical protein E3C22_19385 [Jiella endophytica]
MSRRLAQQAPAALLARLLVAGVVLLSALSGPALAQVPDHAPGTICFTEHFWCWASPPGIPGNECFCPSIAGPQAGTLG